MSSGVYAIRNLANGKMYVGSSSDFDRRKATHLRALRLGKHHSPILQNAWIKYGEDKFAFEMLEEVEPTYGALRDREQHYLDALKPAYNVNDVADGHFRLGKRNTPEHRSKISASNMGRPGTNNGKRFSEEHRSRISEANKGKTRRPVGYRHTVESIEKMRAKASSLEERARRSERMRMLWKALSPEQRASRVAKMISLRLACTPVGQ